MEVFIIRKKVVIVVVYMNLLDILTFVVVVEGLICKHIQSLMQETSFHYDK